MRPNIITNVSSCGKFEVCDTLLAALCRTWDHGILVATYVMSSLEMSQLLRWVWYLWRSTTREGKLPDASSECTRLIPCTA